MNELDPKLAPTLAARTLKVTFVGFLRLFALMLLFLWGALVAFLSQATATDYRRLFWWVAPMEVVHLFATTLYFWRVRSWMRWCALAFAIVALLCFVELAVRVWRFH